MRIKKAVLAHLQLRKGLYLSLVTLTIISAICYAPLLELEHCMKYDMMDQFFQYRFFLSDCLSNDIWPLWQPWQHYGFPFFADPQSAAWYAPTWIIAWITDYDIYSLHYEWWGHVLWGSIGILFALRKFKVSWTAALIVALFYQGNGVFLGNAQHFTYVIAMSWLPWVIVASYSFIQQPSFRNSILLAFTMSFLITGGYPAFYIICCYLLGATILIRIYHLFKSGNGNKVRNLLLFSLLFAAALLVIIGPYLYSILEGAEKMIRSDGISLEDALFGPFPPSALVSIIHPLPVTAPPNLFGADKSMLNGYIGLLPFLMIPWAWRSDKTRVLIWCIFVLGIVCLLAAFGEHTPIREWLYYLPFMDTFRFPSVFRSFWMMALFLLSGFGIDQILSRNNSGSLLLLPVAAILIFALFSLLPFQLSWSPEELGTIWDVFKGDLRFQDSDFMEPPALFTLAACSVAAFSLAYLSVIRFAGSWTAYLFIGLAALEVFLAIRWSLPVTVLHERPGTEYQAALSTVPEGYPIPDQTPFHANRPARPRFLPSWYNNNVFTKTVSPIGLNPFKFKSLDHMEKRDCYQSALSSPLLFFTGEGKTAKYQLNEWAPGHAEISLQIQTADTLVFQQSVYPGWSATVNGAFEKILPWCGHLISLPVPSGQSQIRITFQRPGIKALWVWQGILSLAIALFLLLPYFRKTNR